MGVKLYIGNLLFGTTDQELKIIADRFAGRSRGFGFMERSTQEEAEQAINALPWTNFGGSILMFNEACPLEEKRPFMSDPPNTPSTQ